MSTHHTTNYDLNQWEGTDKVLRAEFNADNAKIDAALKANADAIAAEAAARAAGDGDLETAMAALETALAGKADAGAVPQFVTGSYTGTGEAGVTKHYSLGYRPKMVLLRTENTTISYIFIRGLLVTELCSIQFESNGEADMRAPGVHAGLEEDGFYIVHDSNIERSLNNTGKVQHYLVWK